MEFHLAEAPSTIEVWKKQFWKSIKAFDTEDKIDLYFFRPAGFFIAKFGVLLEVTPTELTVAGMFFGIASGFLFFRNYSNANLAFASVFFVFAGILDSADGQLARMTGKFSRVGLVLDGVCDNIVFVSAYVGSILTLQVKYGGKIWLLGVLAGGCHSAQSAILDFYNREYLYFGCGLHNGDYWNPSVEEADEQLAVSCSMGEKVAWWLRRSWLKQQQFITTRAQKLRINWRSSLLGDRSGEFQSLYREQNHFVLRLWRPLGANFHTIMIILFACLRRFELYLLFVDVIFLTAWLVIVRAVQQGRDQRFQKSLGNWGF